MPRVPAHLLVDPTTQQNEPEFEYSGPSKSQRKRDMTALQDLGARLVALPATRLAQLPLPERLVEAIREAQRIKSHEAKRRQMQFIGKLMRDIDSDAIAAQLHDWDNGSRQQNDHFHALEQWRDRLLESDDAFTVLLEHRPNIDIQHLRNQIRQARREQAHNATLAEGHTPLRKHYRELFQSLKQILDTPDDTAN